MVSHYFSSQRYNFSVLARYRQKIGGTPTEREREREAVVLVDAGAGLILVNFLASERLL
jgi:hypothetical protein